MLAKAEMIARVLGAGFTVFHACKLFRVSCCLGFSFLDRIHFFLAALQ